MNSKEAKSINYEMIDKYLKLMLKKNEVINLTRVTDYNQALILHIEDSLAVLDELINSPEGLYGDLGSGCGFPGIALSIASNRKTILIDSVKKKMKAVEEIINELGIDNQISTNASRIEDLSREMPEKFSVLTARALSSLPSLLELASPLLKNKGQLIALKSHVSEEELNNALNIEEQTGMRLISNRDFFLSDNETFRSVYVFEKSSKPSVKLPRRIGLAQKQPLK